MTDDTISPLRRRMIEDMTVRGFTACTQRGYIAAVRRFTVFLGRSPDQATAEDLRRFQLQMRVEGASATTMNAAVSALRFLFGVTLGRGEAEVGLTTVREPRRLPVVLSPEEVTRLLDAAPGLKYRAALSLSYGAGLRASEVVSLKVSDIDSSRHYGLFANGGRTENLARVRELLAVPAPQDEPDDADANADEPPTPSLPCPCCGGRMIIVETFERGSTPRTRPPSPLRIDTSRHRS